MSKSVGKRKDAFLVFLNERCGPNMKSIATMITNPRRIVFIHAAEYGCPRNYLHYVSVSSKGVLFVLLESHELQRNSFSFYSSVLHFPRAGSVENGARYSWSTVYD
jgi:hypothetical protein